MGKPDRSRKRQRGRWAEQQCVIRGPRRSLEMMPLARAGRGHEVRGRQGPRTCNISGEQMMRGLSSGGERLASWALTGLVCTALTGAAAQDRAPAPDFSSNQVGWIATNPDFIAAVPGAGPAPRAAIRPIPTFPTTPERSRLSGSPTSPIPTSSLGPRRS